MHTSLAQLCSALVISAFMLTAIGASADPLEKVLTSKQMQRFNSRTRTIGREERTKRWFEEGSPLEKLFKNREAALDLTGQILPQESVFARQRQAITREREFLVAHDILLRRVTNSSDRLDVRVFVIHPKYLQIAELNLLKKLQELHPPFLKIKSSETVKIRGIATEVYRLPRDFLSLTYRPFRGVYIQLRAQRWTMLGDVVRLAEAINIDELKKLTSADAPKIEKAVPEHSSSAEQKASEKNGPTGK